MLALENLPKIKGVEIVSERNSACCCQSDYAMLNTWENFILGGKCVVYKAEFTVYSCRFLDGIIEICK